LPSQEKISHEIVLIQAQVRTDLRHGLIGCPLAQDRLGKITRQSIHSDKNNDRNNQ
jgi:hypothetical protein